MDQRPSRKDLIREYKDTARPMGVFGVRNLRNGKWLIGASADLPSMLNRQQAQLRFGGHPNHELQRDWKELGVEAFAFEILDTLKPSDQPGYDPRADLKTLEELWLEKLSPYDDRGYNVRAKER